MCHKKYFTRQLSIVTPWYVKPKCRWSVLRKTPCKLRNNRPQFHRLYTPVWALLMVIFRTVNLWQLKYAILMSTEKLSLLVSSPDAKFPWTVSKTNRCHNVMSYYLHWKLDHPWILHWNSKRLITCKGHFQTNVPSAFYPDTLMSGIRGIRHLKDDIHQWSCLRDLPVNSGALRLLGGHSGSRQISEIRWSGNRTDWRTSMIKFRIERKLYNGFKIISQRCSKYVQVGSCPKILITAGLNIWVSIWSKWSRLFVQGR